MFEIGQRVICYGKYAGVIVEPRMKLPEGLYAVRHENTGYGMHSSLINAGDLMAEQALQNRAQAPLMRANFDLEGSKGLGKPKPSKSRGGEILKIRQMHVNPNPPEQESNVAAIIAKWRQTPSQQAAIRARLQALPTGSTLTMVGERLEWVAPTDAEKASVEVRPAGIEAGERSGLVAVGKLVDGEIVVTKGTLNG